MEKVRKRGVSLFTVFLMVVLAIGLMPQFGAGGRTRPKEAQPWRRARMR